MFMKNFLNGKDSKFFDETNKKILGKMKDEFGGAIANEFLGLKSKIYSIKKLMVKNIILQKEWVLQLNLINSKMSYFMKKSSDTKSKEFKVKIINEEHMKLTKYFYNVLTITDTC